MNKKDLTKYMKTIGSKGGKSKSKAKLKALEATRAKRWLKAKRQDGEGK